ncbi:MAG: acyl--CoA ligase [Actinobacteria bacterium]|nr:acyl--CoA ligase [Actinomycetota bacterium]
MRGQVLITHLLANSAAETPDDIALRVDGGEQLSYAEWDRRSNRAARGLLARQVSAGDAIGLYFENQEWIEFAIAYMGVLKAGAVAVPLSSRFEPGDVQSILQGCGAVGMVCRDGAPAAAGWLAPLETLADGQSEEPLRDPLRTEEDIAEILYTSGTTGRSQGVACRHMHVVRPLVDGRGWPPDWWGRGGSYLHANSVSTAAGQLRLLEPLGPARMTALALPVFEPDRYCALAAGPGVQAVQLVPAMATSILDSGAAARHDLSGVRVVSLGCAPLPPFLVPRLAAAFPAARLVNMYELTEARYAGTCQVHDRSSGRSRLGSVGRPRGASQVRITGEQGEPVPAGVVGEVRLRWDGLPPQHYYQDAAATARVFVNGWTRTGDSGYLDEEGHLYLVDRMKDVIIKGGVSIGSLEIENALREHPAIVDCAVVGIPDRMHGEEVAAALVTRSPVTPYELRNFFSTRLAAYKVPRRYVALTVLPRNRSGKVLKREIQDHFLGEDSPPENGDRGKLPPPGDGAADSSPDSPVTGTPVVLPDHLLPILDQLIQGATDVTASRRLKVSPRTFSRRVAELLEFLHVQTRFQCGAKAVLHGWLSAKPAGPPLPARALAGDGRLSSTGPAAGENLPLS